MSNNSAVARIGFVGDIGLGPAHADMLQEHGADFLHAKVDALFADVDLIVGNLECSVPDFDAAGVLTADLYTTPELLHSLGAQSKLCVCLANNHIADYGDESVMSTIRQLEKAGIPCFGAGKNYASAVAPLKLQVGEMSLGLVSASDFHYAGATRRSAGSAPLDVRRLLRQVRELKGACTHVIVIIHADEEFQDFPAPYRVRLSRKLVDVGADAVVQHHPHVVQGVEYYKGKTIAYSLGNWAFKIGDYQSAYQQTKFGAFLTIELPADKSAQQSSRMSHTIIDDLHRPALPSAAEVLEQENRLDFLSQKLSDKKFLRQHWFRTCSTSVKRELMTCYYIFRRSGSLALGGRLRHLLKEPLFRRQLLGLLSFGAH